MLYLAFLLYLLPFISSKVFANPYTDPCDDGKRLCFAYPSSCLIDSDADCDILVRTLLVDDGIRFELFGLVTEKDRWFAAGLSSDQQMGQDSVALCLYTVGQQTIMSDMYTTGETTPTAVTPRAYFNDSIAYKDGYLQCEWTRGPKYKVFDTEFDLANKTYYLLMAFGSATASNVIKKHHKALASNHPIDFHTTGTVIVNSDVADLIKVHGSFMLISWIGIVSLSILIARYYKPHLPWFNLHRLLMVFALLFVIIGMTSIFVHVGGFRLTSLHQILGVTANVLMFCQPVMAMLRCSPDHERRPIFNWLHFLVGNTAHVLAILAIFFATCLEAARLPASFIYVLGTFVAIHCLVHLLLTLHSMHVKNEKNKGRNAIMVATSEPEETSPVNEAPRAEAEAEVESLAANNNDTKRKTKDEDTDGIEFFRHLVLGGYMLFIIIIEGILIYLTVMDRKKD